ncbi:MAG: envelope stress response membrane protein PspC [Pseudomonadota bacterium]
MRRSRQNYRDFRRAFKSHMRKAKADFQRDWDETMHGRDPYDVNGDGMYGYDEDGDYVGRRSKSKRHKEKLGYQSRSRFYLDKRRAKFLGVCAGIADYTGISTFWVRLAFILLVLFGFPPIILGYFIVALIADAKPREHYTEKPQEQEFWRNVRTRPHTTVRDVRLRFKDMERRLRDLETYVTSGSRRLNREINALRD